MTHIQVVLRKITVICCMSLLLAVPHFASAKELSPGEYLIFEIPDELVYHLAWTDQSRDQKIFEYVPKGQTVHNWRHMVTIMAFSDMRGVTAKQMARRMIAGVRSECDSCSGKLLKSGRVGRYPYALFRFGAPKPSNGDHPEWNAAIAVRGNDSMYPIMKAWRQEPKQSEVNYWLSLLRAAGVCDNRKGDKCVLE